VGVDLGGLVESRAITFQDLSGKVVAIDAYNTLYQFLAIIRGPDGTPLKDDQGRVTSHLSGLLQRTSNLTAAGIYPAFVFDGAPHPLKLKTIEERQRIRQKAMREYEAAVEVGDLQTARSKAQQTSTLSKEMVEQAKRLLGFMGLPVIQAPGEGEAQASFMARKGLAYGCGSQDFDCLLFGVPHLIRNLAVTGRRRMPGKQAFTEVTPEVIDLEPALAALKLTREQLVDVAILVGTDYNSGVAGIGPKTALKLIQENGSLEACMERAPKEEGAMWKRLASVDPAAIGDLPTMRKLFLDPVVEPDVKVEFGRLDRASVLRMMVEEHRFLRERVESSLDKLASGPMYKKQKSIVDWG
jgi:flap endonuclease-1